MLLRGESSDGWEQFVLALREYAAMATADMIKVPVEELPRRQGMALSLHVLASLLRDAPSIHQKHLERVKMADQQEQTPEQKYGPKLLKQIQDQVDAVSAALNQPDEEAEQQSDEQEQPELEEDGQQEPPEGQPQELQPDSWEQRARSAQGRLEQALGTNQQLARRVSELEDQMSGKS